MLSDFGLPESAGPDQLPPILVLGSQLPQDALAASTAQGQHVLLGTSTDTAEGADAESSSWQELGPHLAAAFPGGRVCLCCEDC